MSLLEKIGGRAFFWLGIVLFLVIIIVGTAGLVDMAKRIDVVPEIGTAEIWLSVTMGPLPGTATNFLACVLGSRFGIALTKTDDGDIPNAN